MARHRRSPRNDRAGAASPVKTPKAAEVVAGELRGRIVRGELKEGDLLPPEAAIQEAFGVSRPTLREALRILESERLITVQRGAGGGVKVHAPDVGVASRYVGLILQSRKTTLADVYAARLMLEPVAARVLAERRSKRTALALRRLIEEQRAVSDAPEALARAGTRFHEQLIELTGNQTLALLIGLLHDIVESHTTAAVVAATREFRQDLDLESSFRVMSRLVDHIEAGRGLEAERLWRRHLEDLSKAQLKGLGGRMVLDLLT